MYCRLSCRKLSKIEFISQEKFVAEIFSQIFRTFARTVFLTSPWTEESCPLLYLKKYVTK